MPKAHRPDKSTPLPFEGKAREVVNLVTSQVNACEYCLAAHTLIGKMYGFSDAQILEIRRRTAGFDPKLDALARLVRNMVLERGHTDPALVDAFFAAGWTGANLVDAVVAVGDKWCSSRRSAICPLCRRWI